MCVKTEENTVIDDGRNTVTVFFFNNKLLGPYGNFYIFFGFKLILDIINRYSIAGRQNKKGSAVLYFHSTVEDVGMSDKGRNKKVCRPLIQIFRPSDMLDVAFIHNRNPIGNSHRFFLIVRDIDSRNTDFVLKFFYCRAHFHTELCVKV